MFVIDDCKYGDRQPDECSPMDYTNCYEQEFEKKCCESCGYYRLDEKPYGIYTMEFNMMSYEFNLI